MRLFTEINNFSSTPSSTYDLSCHCFSSVHCANLFFRSCHFFSFYSACDKVFSTWMLNPKPILSVRFSLISRSVDSIAFCMCISYNMGFKVYLRPVRVCLKLSWDPQCQSYFHNRKTVFCSLLFSHQYVVKFSGGYIIWISQ